MQTVYENIKESLKSNFTTDCYKNLFITISYKKIFIKISCNKFNLLNIFSYSSKTK